MKRLDGKVAIITGASKGLGEADARMFAREGATVWLTDVDESAGKKIADDIGSQARFVRQDVRDEDEWKALIARVVQEDGKLDILVNNAGVVEIGTIENHTTEDFRFVMAVSVEGTFFGCKYAIPAMKESGGGSIINMASIASVQGAPNVIAYCAAKGAVESMTRGIAAHCASNKLGIRCNSIHPSGMVTPMVMTLGEKFTDKEMTIEDAQAGGVTSKLGEPADIANAALFLASDESRFINGAQIRVDNGISVVSAVVE